MEGASNLASAGAGQQDGRAAMQKRQNFTLAGALLGARKTLPIALSVFAVGTVFGVLARQAGLAPAESLLMSGMVFAGASQFVALSLWTAPLPVATLILTTLVVNLRHLLMGVAWGARFPRLPARKAFISAFFMVDESWALAMRDADEAGEAADGAFMLGSGASLFVAWMCATLVGLTVGSLVRDPAQWGLDFAFTAAFLALLVGMWKGRSTLLPWVVAAVVAIAAAHWLPGKWYILLGGLAGSLVGAWMNGD